MNKDFGKILYYEGKHYLVESAHHYDVANNWFGVPIYEIDGKIETRNAGSEWLFGSNGAFLVLDYPVEKYKKVIQSQIDHYNWCIDFSIKEYQEKIKEYQEKIKLLEILQSI